MIVVKYKPNVKTNDVFDSYFNEEFYQIVSEGLNDFFEDNHIMVTSGTDGDHTEGSMHYQSKAVDLRIRHLKTEYLKYTIDHEVWASALYLAFASIAEQLPKYCFIVHAKDNKRHVHVQYSRENIRGMGLGLHRNLYLK
jgi:hypothetical protein